MPRLTANLVHSWIETYLFSTSTLSQATEDCGFMLVLHCPATSCYSDPFLPTELWPGLEVFAGLFVGGVAEGHLLTEILQGWAGCNLSGSGALQHQYTQLATSYQASCGLLFRNQNQFFLCALLILSVVNTGLCVINLFLFSVTELQHGRQTEQEEEGIQCQWWKS